jgi:hypothetical protein
MGFNKYPCSASSNLTDIINPFYPSVFHVGTVPMLIFIVISVGSVPIAGKVTLVYGCPKVYSVFAKMVVLLTLPVRSPVPVFMHWAH